MQKQQTREQQKMQRFFFVVTQCIFKLFSSCFNVVDVMNADCRILVIIFPKKVNNIIITLASCNYSCKVQNVVI